MVEYKEGNVITTNIRRNAGSLYLLLSPEILNYLSLEEKDSVIIKFEKSKKWGNYIGVGKDKR